MRLRAKRRERIKGGGQRMISSSRTSHRVSTKACTDVSLFCISNKTVVRVFWGANRKDVINLTTTTKKNKDMKEAFYLFFASCHAKRESQSHTRKKGVVKSRGGYFFFRIMGRDFASSSAFKERKRFFFNRTRLKNWTHPTSRYRTHNHLVSSHHLRFPSL